MRNILHRDLPVLCRIADVLRVRTHDIWEFILERLNHVPRLIERQGGLGQVSDTVGIRNNQIRNLLNGRDDLRHVRSLALRAFNLVVVAVSDQHQRITLLRKLDRLNVDLRYKRAGRINDLQATFLGTFTDGGGDAMGGIDYARAFGNFVQFVDKGS